MKLKTDLKPGFKLWVIIAISFAVSICLIMGNISGTLQWGSSRIKV